METKTCKRCGTEQPVDNFRMYYNGHASRYTFCRTCERIEARRKYLVRGYERLNDEQKKELESIEALYEARQAAGLAVPGRSRGASVVSLIVDDQLNKLKEKA